MPQIIQIEGGPTFEVPDDVSPEEMDDLVLREDKRTQLRGELKEEQESWRIPERLLNTIGELAQGATFEGISQFPRRVFNLPTDIAIGTGLQSPETPYPAIPRIEGDSRAVGAANVGISLLNSAPEIAAVAVPVVGPITMGSYSAESFKHLPQVAEEAGMLDVVGTPAERFESKANLAIAGLVAGGPAVVPMLGEGVVQPAIRMVRDVRDLNSPPRAVVLPPEEAARLTTLPPGSAPVELTPRGFWGIEGQPQKVSIPRPTIPEAQLSREQARVWRDQAWGKQPAQPERAPVAPKVEEAKPPGGPDALRKPEAGEPVPNVPAQPEVVTSEVPAPKSPEGVRASTQAETAKGPAEVQVKTEADPRIAQLREVGLTEAEVKQVLSGKDADAIASASARILEGKQQGTVGDVYGVVVGQLQHKINTIMGKKSAEVKQTMTEELRDVSEVANIPERENGGRTALILPDGTAIVARRPHADILNKAQEAGIASADVLDKALAGMVRPDGKAWTMDGADLPHVKKVYFVDKPAPVTAAKTPVQTAKEPWQMTQREYNTALASEYDSRAATWEANAKTAGTKQAASALMSFAKSSRAIANKLRSGKLKVPPTGGDPASTLKAHRPLVADALREGKPVPSEVLADYPDLVRKTPPTEGTPLPEEGHVGMGAAVPSEFKGGPSPTAIKNAAIDADRARMNLPPMAKVVPQAWEDAWNRAMGRIDREPQWQDNLIAELIAKPRPATPEEHMALLQRKVDLKNEYNRSAREANQAYEDGRLEDMESANARTQGWVTKIEEIDKATGKGGSGTEAGRALAVRKALMAEDFTLETLELQKRADLGGRPLTAPERAELIKIADTYKAKAEALETRAVKAEERVREQMLSGAISNAQKGRFGERTPKDLGKAIDETNARLRARIAKGDVEGLSSLVQRLARYFVQTGIRERNALVDAVHDVLKEIDPRITRRDTMDAISGYGSFKALSKDEVSVILRDLKGQMQQVAKLTDLEAKRPLQKTGVERREPSAEERRLIQRVNEAKRRFGVVVTDPATQLKSALDARKTYYKHQIDDLQAQITAKEKFVKTKTPSPTDAELEALKLKRDELKTEFDNIFGKKEMTEAHRVDLAIRSVERSITDLERRIKERDLFPQKPKKAPVSSPELELLRLKKEGLKAELDVLRGLADTGKMTPEQIALRALKRRLIDERIKYQTKLFEGDFEKAPRQQSVVRDKEADLLQFDLDKIKSQWMEGRLKDQMAQWTWRQKAWDKFMNIVGLDRAIITSFEMSAVLRQGKFYVMSHPVKGLKRVPDAFRAMRSEQARHAIDLSIQARDNAPFYERDGLYLAEHGTKLSKMEETYRTRWSDKVSGVAASERAYTTFLNLIRADFYDGLASRLSRRGEISPEHGKAIANFVNVWTGRGTLPGMERAAGDLANIFFAPRYVASRFQALTGSPFRKAPSEVKGLVLKEYGRTLGGLAIYYTLISTWLGDDVEINTNPTATDFGKIRVGDTRIDPMTGIAQITTLLARVGLGETTTQRGAVIPLRDKWTWSGAKARYGGPTVGGVTGAFLRQKFHPSVQKVADIATGESAVGEPVTPEYMMAWEVPITYKGMLKTLEDQGIPRGTALMLLAFFGEGVQTYDNPPPKPAKQRSRR